MINAYIQGSYVRLDGKLAGIQGESMSRTLRLNFSPEWGELTKRILWLDARGKQVVSQPLVASADEVLENNGLVIPVKIPGEALQYDGKTVFIVEGEDENGAISLSAMAEMTVNPNDFYGKNAINATEPTPTEMQQLQEAVEEAIGVAAADKQAAQAAAAAAAQSEDAAEDAAGTAIENANRAEGYTNNPPVPGAGGTWLVWDGEKYVDSGKSSQGPQGPSGPAGDTGPQGEKGETGSGFKVLDYYSTLAGLQSGVTNPNAGDAYGVGADAPYDIYIYSPSNGWVNNGPLQGAQGPTGPQGPEGPQGPAGKDGQDGQPGEQGPAGANGSNGADGKDATINGVNALTIVGNGGVAASQSGSTLNLSVSGTFAGQAVANSSGQTPGTSLLRNSQLATAEGTPTNNGEIIWVYG